MTRDLQSVITIDHTDQLRRIKDSTYNRNRTLHIRFHKESDGYALQAWGSALPQDGGGGYQGRLTVAPATIEAAIDRLRSTWQEHVIGHRDVSDELPRYPYVDQCDLSGPDDCDRLHEIGLQLARSGHSLFQLLFQGGDAGLKEISDHLVDALRSGEQVMTMESDDLFVPWGMLYLPPDETSALWGLDAEWSMEGFWGYRHIIEHGFSRVPGFESRVLMTSHQAAVGLNVDEGVDEEYPPTPFIAPVVDFFTDRAQVTVRRSKNELAVALQDPQFNDHITYFGCHGKVSDGDRGQSYLVLGDGEKIYSSEIIGWLTGQPLLSKPVVFVSACQGGQLSSHFYQAFGHHLLQHGARCLVGPQIDLPREFAREYTQRLFTEFLQPDTRLGDVMRDLAREFADDMRNPLGLIFSLYRGMDVHLWAEESR